MLIKSASLSSPKTARVSPGKKSLRESVQAQLSQHHPRDTSGSILSQPKAHPEYEISCRLEAPRTSTTCCIASVRLFFRASELGRPQSYSAACLRSQRRPRRHSAPVSQGRGSWVSRFPRMQALIVCTGCKTSWDLLSRLSHRNQNVQITKGERGRFKNKLGSL